MNTIAAPKHVPIHASSDHFSCVHCLQNEPTWTIHHYNRSDPKSLAYKNKQFGSMIDKHLDALNNGLGDRGRKGLWKKKTYHSCKIRHKLISDKREL